MSQEWMLDLITDLRGFAQKNLMTDLAEHLDDALLIAARELRATSDCTPLVAFVNEPDYPPSRSVADSDNA